GCRRRRAGPVLALSVLSSPRTTSEAPPSHGSKLFPHRRKNGRCSDWHRSCAIARPSKHDPCPPWQILRSRRGPIPPISSIYHQKLTKRPEVRNGFWFLTSGITDRVPRTRGGGRSRRGSGAGSRSSAC